ncbi:hypothetical protein WS68_15130 [Burkholderia sp. TSV86]|nr:hypothetical protein WS68_15130 [Burkholderia sp. TSV86]
MSAGTRSRMWAIIRAPRATPSDDVGSPKFPAAQRPHQNDQLPPPDRHVHGVSRGIKQQASRAG